MDAAKFYWAIVGDASPEPVAVVEEHGKRVAYTCGCPDPFDVDGPDANIILIPPSRHADGSEDPENYNRPDDWFKSRGRKGWVLKPLDVPPTPAQAATMQRNERRLRAMTAQHRHRRFNP